MSGFNLANYEPVETRLARFWDDHPEGRVATDLVYREDARYIVRAEVFTDRDDTRPAATGYAEEVATAKGVNSTSALENCETSAVGRALANLNYAPKGARPSREEMAKAQRGQEDTNGRTVGHDYGPNDTPDTPGEARAALAARAKEVGMTLEEVAASYTFEHGGDLASETDSATIRKFTAGLKAESDGVSGDLRQLATGATK